MHHSILKLYLLYIT